MMKKIAIMLMAAAAVLTPMAAGAQNPFAKRGANDMSEKKILVACFSWSGNTKAAARHIADKLGADWFEIKRVQPYPADYDDCTREAKAEKESGKRPDILGKVPGMERYDVVFVCVPVWWYTAPMPVFTFLEDYDFKGKLVIPFCTAYTAEYETLRDIAKATPHSDHRDGLCIVTQDVDGNGMEQRLPAIDRWLSRIGF
ncbi:MAG: flavodoxin family protein [Bacteroidales bacterium]|nr:flavodoxin family protein [Bacteroidales bacterium]